MHKGFCLTALAITVLGMAGCAQQSQPASYSSSTYHHPTHFGSLPERTHENQDHKAVAGYPEGHPLAGTEASEHQDVTTQTSRNTEAQFELD